MGFWVYMFFMNLTVPLLLIGFGWAFQKHPPKQINSIYGYRTRMSQINMDTWHFAHLYFGKLWFRAGLITLPFTVIGMLPAAGKSEKAVGIVSLIIITIQMIPLLLPIYFTERALRRRFDQSGRIRQ